MRIGVGYLLQETNTFSPVETRLKDFGLVEGPAVLDRWSGTQTEVGAFLDVLGGTSHQVVPLIAGWAMTAGLMSAATFEELLSIARRRLSDAGPLDGLLLALHGSMCARGTDDCDGGVIEAARAIVGDIPIVVTLDLHANLTAKIASLADAVIGYQCYPHTDMYETGLSAAELLLKTLSEEISPASAMRKLPLIVPAENMQTTHGPMKQVFDTGYAYRDAHPEVLSVSSFGVQPWLDIEEMGCATLAVADRNQASARDCAREMGERLWSLREEFTPRLLRPRQAIEQALAEPGSPVVLAESSDGPTAGAPGDSAELVGPLQQFAPGVPSLLWMRDPKAVDQAWALRPGDRFRAAVGGVFDKMNHVPALIDGTLRSLSDGTFRFTGNYNKGMLNEMGRTAVIQAGSMTVVMSDEAANMIAPEVYRSQGLEPRDYKIVVVKSANSFRSEYTFASKIIIVDTPGISTANLRSLPYQRVPRPIYPLDEISRLD